MASLVVKRGRLHYGLGKVGILGEYLLSSLSALFLGRFSSNKDHFEAADLYFTMGRMKSSSRANNMASLVVKRGRLHYGLGKVGILGEYLLSSLSALFLGRFSSNKDHFEAADLYFTMGRMKSSSRANNMASLVVKRGRLHYGLGKVGILGEYLLSSLSALFLGRFSSNKDHFEAADLYFTMGRMKSSSRANNMASLVVKRGRLHYGPGKVGILGEYLLSSLSALFHCRFSSNTDHFEAGDLYFLRWVE